MWKRLCCWRGKARKSKGFRVLDKICGCAFAVVWGENCFRLPWWGKENERFGKIIIANQIVDFFECGGESWRIIIIRYD